MNIWIVIPVLDHAANLRQVVAACRERHPQILVVDGSREPLEPVLRDLDVTVLRLPDNTGRGGALLAALEFVAARDADYMVTLDADGRHSAADLPLFLAKLADGGRDKLLIGCRELTGKQAAEASGFGRRVSNFWLRIETGVACRDARSGFRAYPVRLMRQMRFRCRRSGFETEALTRLIWNGAKWQELPIRCDDPERGNWVGLCRPLANTCCITLLHLNLVLLRLLPWNGLRQRTLPESPARFSIFRPRELIGALVAEHSTPQGLAAAAFTGTLLAVLPLVGFHTAAILYASFRLHLNKVMALNIQHLFLPPFTPFLCIQLGFFMRHGRFWTELTFQSLVAEMPQRFWEWLLGSLVLAPLFGAVTATATFGIAHMIRRRYFVRAEE